LHNNNINDTIPSINGPKNTNNPSGIPFNVLKVIFIKLKSNDISVSIIEIKDKTLRDLPRGVDQYLEQREESLLKPNSDTKPKSASSAAEQRQLKKDLVRVERQIQKSKEKITELEEAQESVAFDPAELLRISEELENQRTELNTREEEWLEITDQLGD
jgi:ATPase subunit of ABC transporter with duplicated ATPase domains